VTALRYLTGRLPWVALGAAVGAGVVWLALWRPEPTPEAPPAEVATIDPLNEDPERAKAVGERLRQVKAGMTRREVEALLGPPGREDWRQFTVRWRTDPDGQARQQEIPYVTYYCSPPDLPPGRHLMTIEYDTEPLVVPIPLGAKVIGVSGPHTPEGCG
jgi:hypothetical protein